MAHFKLNLVTCIKWAFTRIPKNSPEKYYRNTPISPYKYQIFKKIYLKICSCNLTVIQLSQPISIIYNISLFIFENSYLNKNKLCSYYVSMKSSLLLCRRYLYKNKTLKVPNRDCEKMSRESLNCTAAKRMCYNECYSNNIITRPWVRKSDTFDTPPRGNVRICSYNILAQQYAEQNPFLYTHLTDGHEDLLSWATRWPKIMGEITTLQPDVLCLQEVESCHFQSAIRPYLEANGYEVQYYQKRQNLPDGSVIAFKSEQFSADHHTHSHINMFHLKKCHTGQIGIVLVLTHTGTGEKFIIANTHLVYNPYRGDWKMKQLVHLFAAIQYHKEKLKLEGVTNPTVIFCGDFNSLPESALVQFILKGSINLDGIRAQDIAGQPIAPRNYYKFKHGHIGNAQIDRDFFEDTSLTRTSIYGQSTPLSAHEPYILTHDLKLKW